MRRKVIISTISAVAVAAIVGALVVTQRFPSKVAAAAPPAVPTVPVVAGSVNSSDVPIYLQGVGTVIAYNTVIVRSQIQGQITKINFTEGQTVKTGDLLAVIDPRPYQAQLDQANANRARDEAQLTNAQSNLKRYTTLGNQGWATPQLVETQTAQVAQLNAAIKADEAAIEWAQTQLSYTQLTSPIDGVTDIRQVDIGNIIHPTDPNGLVVVTQVEPISVIFTLPETNLPQVQQHLADGTLKVEAYSQDNTMKLDEGNIDFIDNEIVQTTGSVRFRANFPNKEHKLWPGELVNAWLLLDTRHDGLTVSASAGQQGPPGPYAYVINADSTVAVRPVKVAQVSGGQALIDSRLSAGGEGVVDGQKKLQPRLQFAIPHGKAAEGAAAQGGRPEPGA